ncbi:MAG: hypothetical protein CVV64_14330 [Candidatus Wallbacteria bacterium HGW-Wallbacteria-1]|jgi:hypothetical protein|uniref:Uncharacterized protein n=1 Tax=Candidatus Wallbacteria bacterium HGW-Wallbacteria-1 TaxID=2013854 RepID=A0A2N1PM87_9BACT|nr:MAG: hypothetical protein CVV64_14330 [Candidatus Wallbacteria bacterium HGW-Wallbacteria-1]
MPSKQKNLLLRAMQLFDSDDPVNSVAFVSIVIVFIVLFLQKKTGSIPVKELTPVKSTFSNSSLQKFT